MIRTRASLGKAPVRYAALALLCSTCFLSHSQSPAKESNDPRAWLRKVRIAAYPLSSENAEAIVRQANESGVYGIEVDNDIPGRYESLLQPADKLEALRRIASAAHAHGQKAFVYVAGFECISAHADSAHTVFKDHPEWLQRKLSGQPAIFDTKAAFWIAKGEEDVWISPYAVDWRKLYMQRIREIAATGIDGIYVDIPYWMTHFTGWEDSWASFDGATVAAFRQQTGLDATKDIKVGDFSDPGFRKWINFRIETITAFMAEIRQNAVAVKPDISIIPEIYPGIEQEATRVGADVYSLYPVVDAIAHEYEFGEGDDHTAASRTSFDWMMYQIGIRSFRAFAGDKPTWILNYSWDGAPHVKPAEAMQTLFMSEVMAGANVWDPKGHVMSGSNDLNERRNVYKWLAAHEDIFGEPRQPIGEVGVYFSDASRNFYPTEFLASYRGTVMMLLQTHRQFQIVTPRTLANFHGSALVLPDARVLSDAEVQSIGTFSDAGGRIIITGHVDDKLEHLAKALRFPDDPAAVYLASAQLNFDSSAPSSDSPLLLAIGADSNEMVRVEGSKNLIAHAANLHRRPYIFFANFDGLEAGAKLNPDLQRNIEVSVPTSFGNSMHFLPFLGSATTLRGEQRNGRMHYVIPQVERGAVAWFE